MGESPLWSTTLKFRKRPPNGKTKEVEKQMKTLEEYYEEAPKIISYHAGPDLRKHMLNNPDAVAFIVSFMQEQDWRFDPARGVPLSKFRSRSAAWAISKYKRMLTNSKQMNHNDLMNIEAASDEDAENREQFCQANQYWLELFYNMAKLLPEEIELLDLYSKNNINQIAKDLKLQRSQVSHRIEKILDKLREVAHAG